MSDRAAPEAAPDATLEPPPPLGSWARVYAVVLAALLAELVLLAWLTERYR